MTDTVPTVELDQRFSSPEATAHPWVQVEEILDHSVMFWLSTVRANGRPHATPLPAMWLDGALHFCTGTEEQKTVNLRKNPACLLTTGDSTFGTGIDVVVEGRALRTTERPLLERLAHMWRSRLDWPFVAVDGGFREPSNEVAGQDLAEHAAAHVFTVRPEKVLAFGKGAPFSQTRFRFGAL